MGYSSLMVEKSNRVATVGINRPEKLNALSDKLVDELMRLADDLDGDDEVRAIILTGKGKNFSAGGDLEDFLKFDYGDKRAVIDSVRAYDLLILRLMRLTKPMVAAINGQAIGGGCCLSLCCDIRIAAEDATLWLPFIRLGLAGADMGSSWLLPRIVGLGKASELLLTGDSISSRKALEIGLVNRVVSSDHLLKEAESFAMKMAAGPPLGLAMTKSALFRSYSTDLESQLEYEAAAQSFCLGTEDFQEGLKCLLERRAPSFKGK
ncbi:MAG: enoyl-CoA hydratase/isomerase family protein [Syntrophales bacterium]|nr:enoyl-CoA hydratase/isomerase family protein [Syntrophales bacterium]